MDGSTESDIHQTLHWRRSSHCEDRTCVEVAVDGDMVYVRDSKQQGGPVIGVSREAWRAFIEDVRNM
jgi:hypothetical protein